MPAGSTFLLAVYGTLKRGHDNHLLMLKDQQPIGELFVSVPYRMYATDNYPMIIASPEPHPVFVEIYEVDGELLSKLDRFEAPYRFHREQAFVTELGREIELYVFDDPDVPVEFRLVESGHWPGL